MINAVNYNNSSLPICINLQLGQGCGISPSQNNTFIDIGKVVLSEHDDMLITTRPTDITQVTFSDVSDRAFSVPLSDGSTVVVWQCSSGGAYEICAAKYDKNNNKLLSLDINNPVNYDTNGLQNFPKGSVLPDGRLLINWQGGTKAKAKVFFSNLTTSVDEFYITSAGSPSQFGIAQVVLNDGKVVFFIETLQSARPIINGTILDVDTRVKDNFPVSTSPVGFQQGSAGAALPNGGVAAVWHGAIPGNTFSNVLIKSFSSNMTEVVGERALTADSNGVQIFPFSGDQTFPKVAVSNDKICVIWECVLQGRGSLSDICLNVYDLDFVFIKAFTPLNSYTTNNNKDPYIVSLSSGGFRAVWRSFVQGNTFNVITTLLLDDTVSKVSVESRVNTNSDSLSNNVKVTASSLDGYGAVVTWIGSNYAFIRKFNPQVEANMGGGNDIIVANGGGDRLNCGSGSGDLLNYTGVLFSCTIDLTTGKGCGDDLISECENIICPKSGCNVTANGGNIIYGAAGNDFVTVMGLPVTVYGNGGNDGISFKSLNSPINITRGIGTSGNSNITFNDISTIVGSDHVDGDYIVAGGTIDGGKGDDTIVAIFPAIIDGGLGVNTVSFKLSTKPVTCDLTATTATDGIDTMTLVRIHNIEASPSGGKSTGNTLDNTFYPGAGKDEISGMGGRDKVSYHNSPGPVVVDLTIGRGKNKDSDKGGDARGDTYSGIGDFTGSLHDDEVKGSNKIDDAVLDGGPGNDLLISGDDVLNTVLIGGAGVDKFKPGLIGSAIIKDFEINNGEIIDLTGFTNIHSIKDFKVMKQDVDGNSTNTIIALNDDAEITLENVLMNAMTPEHFKFAPAPIYKSAINPAWIMFGVTAVGATVGLAVTLYRAKMTRDEMALTAMRREHLEKAISGNDPDAIKYAGTTDLPTEVELA